MWASLFLLLLLPLAGALEVCSVAFTPPYFEVSNILLVDSSGNLLVYAPSFHQNSPVDMALNALILYSLSQGPVMFFTSSEANIAGSVYEHQTIIPTSNALVIWASGPVASFLSSGDIYVAGYAVYNGADANCPEDEFFCGDDGNIYYRDWYCDVEKNCVYVEELNQVCSGNYKKEWRPGTTLYVYSDAGSPELPGVCGSLSACNSGDTSCPIAAEANDYCADNYTLVEYNSDCVSRKVNCVTYCQEKSPLYSGGYCETETNPDGLTASYCYCISQA